MTIFAAACSKPQTTDVDYIGKKFTENRAEFKFEPNCKKPKAFREIGKFKVDCIVSVTDKAWEKSYARSHSSFFHFLGTSGYRHIGSTHTPGEFLKADNSDYPIQVFQKPTSTAGCFRRLYIDTSDSLGRTDKAPAGSRIVIADPWVLSCSPESK